MGNYGINRLLRKDELQKLTSTDGIIELLCEIENFKSEDYDNLDPETRELLDYTMNISLINDTQIKGNLRRSFDAGNIALINKKVLTALALLYFGEKDENGRYVKYICPYTGKEYDLEKMMSEKRKTYAEQDLDEILELEHIMPHSSGGGTVLFNCIPSSREANSVSEKGNLHLLDWLTNPESSGIKYYSDGGKERLEKLVKYMISAYEIAFSEYVESDLEFEYEDAGNEEDDIEQRILDAKLENPEKSSKNSKKIRQTQIEGYIPFCIQLLEKLKDEGCDVQELEERFCEITENINIEKYRVVQKVIEELFEAEDEKSYLTYGLNVDYVKLVDSIDTDNPTEIKNVITERFNKIKEIVRDNGKSINDYFISLRDIEDVDILYKKEFDTNEVKNFISQIRLGHDGKIILFIDMLSQQEYTRYKTGKPNSKNIFKGRNEESFKGYENITTKYFWGYSSKDIKNKLEELLNRVDLTSEEKEKLKKAERAIECYEFTVDLSKRIDCFIEMLSEDKYTTYENGKISNSNIFGILNDVKFKGYEEIEGLSTKYFWGCNRIGIKSRLEELSSKTDLNTQEKEKLKKAEKAIECYEFTVDLSKRIDCFIDMLGEEKYTRFKEGRPDGINIFKEINKTGFKGYENIEGLDTSGFWNINAVNIKSRLRELSSKTDLNEDDRRKLKKAERAIECYEFTIHLSKRIDCFIDMLSENVYTIYEKGQPNNKNIFASNSKVKFKGYEDIDGLNTGGFWLRNKNQVKKKIMELQSKSNLTKEEKEKLKKAERAIECYEFVSDVTKRIDCYINMLSQEKYTKYKNGVPDSNNIFSKNNKIKFEGYEDIEGINTSQFWSANANKSKIKSRLMELLNEKGLTEEKKEKLKMAERAIECYEFTTNITKRIDCFIEMLSKDEYVKYENCQADKTNIFKPTNKIIFNGYENIVGLNTGHFWSENKDKIKSRLMELLTDKNVKEEEKEKLKKTKRAIECYEFVTNIDKKMDCFIDMLCEKEYTMYEEGKPDNRNIFAQDNNVNFKGYEDVEGINISRNFYGRNKDRIKSRLKELLNKTDLEEEEKEKLKKAERAIDCYEFTTDLSKRLDCFIEMLDGKKYESYINDQFDVRNLFKDNHKYEFRGYEDIEGLDTKGFWQHNHINIISLLFYNKCYDKKTKQIKESEKDYSGQEYDVARKAILEYAKVNNIDEYIEKLKNEKKKNTLISLRENTQKLTMSEIEKAGRIIRNIQRGKGVNENGYGHENRVR